MTDKIKQDLMRVLADSIDEASFSDGDGFIEMDDDIIHVVRDGVDYFFKVVLTATTQDEYPNDQNRRKNSYR